MDAQSCHTKVSRKKRKLDKLSYSSISINSAFNRALYDLGWMESRTCGYEIETRNEKVIRKIITIDIIERKQGIPPTSESPATCDNQTDFVKERVAVEVQFGKYAFVAYDLFVKHLAFYVRDEIDVGVEILPMKSLQAQMSSGVAYYEGEFYNVIRNGRGVPSVPLVLVGIEP